MREQIIHTIDLFPEINRELIQLLKSLTWQEWGMQTVLPGRTVKDIASHLLDGSLRNLSIQRDGHTTIKTDLTSFEELVGFIQKMNEDWIEVSKRLSPQIITTLLELAENWFYEFKRTLDPYGKAPFAVAWAGEAESQNWFDIAREYTERWHHQMQIRLAVNKPGIDARALFFPVIDTCMLGLPYAYRNADASGGIQIEVTGQAHGVWFLEYKNGQWELVRELNDVPETIIKLPGDIAWRLFFDSISREEAKKHIEISGNKKLAEPLLAMKTVMR